MLLFFCNITLKYQYLTCDGLLASVAWIVNSSAERPRKKERASCIPTLMAPVVGFMVNFWREVSGMDQTSVLPFAEVATAVRTSVPMLAVSLIEAVYRA